MSMLYELPRIPQERCCNGSRFTCWFLEAYSCFFLSFLYPQSPGFWTSGAALLWSSPGFGCPSFGFLFSFWDSLDRHRCLVSSVLSSRLLGSFALSFCPRLSRRSPCFPLPDVFCPSCVRSLPPAFPISDRWAFPGLLYRGRYPVCAFLCYCVASCAKRPVTMVDDSNGAYSVFCVKDVVRGHRVKQLMSAANSQSTVVSHLGTL